MLQYLRVEILRNNSLLSETTSTTYTDNSFSFETGYVYSVIAKNSLGAESEPDELSVDTLPDIASPELNLTHNGDSVTISWSNPYPEVIQFKVKRSDGKVWDVPTTQNTLLDDDSITHLSTYSYQIQSRTATAINDWSDEYSVSYPSIRNMDLSYRTVFNELYITPTVTTNQNGHGTITKFSVEFDQPSQWPDTSHHAVMGNSQTQSFPELKYVLDQSMISEISSVTVLADFADGHDPKSSISPSGLAMPSYLPDSEGTGSTATHHTFADDTFEFYLKKESAQYSISCKYADMTQQVSWNNQTSTNHYSLIISTDSPKVYVDCWNADGTKIASSAFGSETSQYGFDSLHNLSAIFGKFAGISIPLLFVVFVGAVFTAKNAHMGVLVLGGTIGIMGVLGFLSIEPLMWGLIILLVILGLLTGKKT